MLNTKSTRELERGASPPYPYVVLEGPDGAGKTTLAAELSRRLPAMRVAHGEMRDYPGHLLAHQAMLGMLPALLDLGAVVQDRSWLSESIYGSVFRGGRDRSWPFGRLLLRAALTAETLLVLCLSELGVLWETVRGRPEVELAQEDAQLRAVVQLYSRLTDGALGLPLLVLDARAYSPQDTAARVLKLLKRQRVKDGQGMVDRARWRALGVAGNLRRLQSRSTRGLPSLLVGDAPTETAYLPFVDFNHGGCSLWLSKHLDDLGLEERDLVWVNAHDEEGRETPYLPELLRDLAPRVDGVYAVGAAAAGTLSRLDFNFQATLPHPQFLRRFHHHRPAAESEWRLLAERRRSLVTRRAP